MHESASRMSHAECLRWSTAGQPLPAGTPAHWAGVRTGNASSKCQHNRNRFSACCKAAQSFKDRPGQPWVADMSDAAGSAVQCVCVAHLVVLDVAAQVCSRLRVDAVGRLHIAHLQQQGRGNATATGSNFKLASCSHCQAAAPSQGGRQCGYLLSFSPRQSGTGNLGAWLGTTMAQLLCLPNMLAQLVALHCAALL